MNAPIPHQAITTQPFSKWFEVHPGIGISMMDHLYNRLDGAYPHKWRSAFGTQQAIDNWNESWAEAFEEEGITPNHIKAGLRACRSLFDWPPSCAEFIKACKSAVPQAAHVFALPAPKSELSREKAGEMLVTLGASEVMKPKNDHLQWAKNIMERSKKTNHGLSALQIRFAKDALAA